MDTVRSGEPLVARYDGVVCDLDGVVYRGSDAVPEAADTLQQLVARGMKVVYATNNASRVPVEVAAQIAGFGAPAAASDVVSSAEAGAARLARDLEQGASVLALGGDGVVEALKALGLVPVPPGGGADEVAGVSAVLQGYGKQLRVSDFESAARVLTTGLLWVATNDDATLPLPWGQSPGNGAYVDLLATALGRRPDVVGKPHPPLYRLALDRLGTRPDRTLAIGDRLGTDIVGAEAAGIDSAWVLTGVDRPTDLVAADASPTYVLASLEQLLQPYAAPVPDADGWRCGAARVTHTDDGLYIERGSGTSIEVVRAGLAALLRLRDETSHRDQLCRDAEALDRLLDDLPATPPAADPVA
jgi:HAD superfamily hydrolase (TIGR01450 family)